MSGLEVSRRSINALVAGHALALRRQRHELRVRFGAVLKVAAATGAALAIGLLIPLGSIPATMAAFAAFAAVAIVTKAIPPEITAEVRARMVRR